MVGLFNRPARDQALALGHQTVAVLGFAAGYGAISLAVSGAEGVPGGFVQPLHSPGFRYAVHAAKRPLDAACPHRKTC